eukprot:822417-Pleurochrysis_carterae.AAC.1
MPTQLGVRPRLKLSSVKDQKQRGEIPDIHCAQPGFWQVCRGRSLCLRVTPRLRLASLGAVSAMELVECTSVRASQYARPMCVDVREAFLVLLILLDGGTL